LRFKSLGLLVILLVSTPAYSQENSFLIVETLNATPTVFTNKQTFVQEYKIRFLDLSNENKEVYIKEEDFYTDNLGPFKVLNLEIRKETVEKEFLEHDWYLRYTLSVIDLEKGVLKIPSLTIPWTVKKIGEDIDKNFSSWNTHIKTREVPVHYVSTIVPKDPNITVRDEVNLGEFFPPLYFTVAAIFMGTVPTGIWLLMLRGHRRRSSFVAKEAVKDDKGEEYFGDTLEPVSGRVALKELKQNIKKLKRLGYQDPYPGPDYISQLMTDLSSSITAFLRTEVSEFNPGTTQNEMRNILEKSKEDSRSKRALYNLAEKVIAYQSCMQLEAKPNSWPSFEKIDAEYIQDNINQLKWHNRVLGGLKDKFINLKKLDRK
jgi:hypothetical protein